MVIYTHGPTGLRYRGGGREAGKHFVRWELADHPGAVSRDDTTGRFTAVCHECCEDGDFEYFTQAMKLLAEHIKQHRHERTPVRSASHNGYTLYAAADGDLYWASCHHASCGWVSPLGGRPAVIAVTSRHVRTHLANPTPARNSVPNPSRKENPMRTLAAVDTELELAQARLEKLIAEREKLAKRPVEPSRSLITFDIRFTDPGQKYSYAARKAAGLWWITGREGGRGRTWEEMLEFMSQDSNVQAGGPITFMVHRLADGTRVRGE